MNTCLRVITLATVAALVSAETELVLKDEAGDVVFEEGIDYEAFPLSDSINITNGVIVDIPLFGCDKMLYIPQMIRRFGSTTKDGTIVMLIRRGGCKFQDKLLLATTFGAAAVLIYNQGDEPDRLGLASNPYIKNNYDLGVFFLTTAAGLKIQSRSGTAAVTMAHNSVGDECLPFRVFPQITPDLVNYTHIVASTPGENHSTILHRQKVRLAKPQLLLKLVSTDHVFAAQQLIQEIGLLHVNAEGQGVLHVARSPEMIALLVTAGADVELRDKSGMTPLVTNIRNDQPQAVRALLSYGASPYNLVHTLSPLIFACQTHAGMCKLLLDAGSDPNFRPVNSGESALFRAVKRNDLEVAAVLRRGNASLTNHNLNGKSATDIVKTPAMKLALAISDPSYGEGAIEALRTKLSQDLNKTRHRELTHEQWIEAIDAFAIHPVAALDLLLFGFLAHDVGPFGGGSYFFYFLRGFFKFIIIGKVFTDSSNIMVSFTLSYAVRWSLNRSTWLRRGIAIGFFMVSLIDWPAPENYEPND